MIELASYMASTTLLSTPGACEASLHIRADGGADGTQKGEHGRASIDSFSVNF